MSTDRPTNLALNARDFELAIVASRYNPELMDQLIQRTVAELAAHEANTVKIVRVPGSAELPLAASLLAQQSPAPTAIIALGVVIAGSTHHHQVIGDSTAWALQQISLQYTLPVINGILVVENRSQAEDRVGDTINRGAEFASAAIEMAHLTQKWTHNNKTNP
jgi:6,7-dimethyl-8-ribityllumazine synthase